MHKSQFNDCLQGPDVIGWCNELRLAVIVCIKYSSNFDIPFDLDIGILSNLSI